MGFPGNKKVQVAYTVTEDNELKIQYEVTRSSTSISSPIVFIVLKSNGVPVTSTSSPVGIKRSKTGVYFDELIQSLCDSILPD